MSSFDVALDLLAGDLSTRWVSRAQADRVVRQAYRFASFCERGFKVDHLALATPAIAAAFLAAPSAEGGPATSSLQRSRRHAVRTLYRVPRAAGLTTIDPTLDLAIPPLSSLRARR